MKSSFVGRVKDVLSGRYLHILGAFVTLYQVREMEDKLMKLRGGVTLVRPEDRKAVEEIYSEKISQWRKRKRIFKDLWDAITENSPKDIKEFKVLYMTFLCCKHSCFFSLGMLLTAVCADVGRTWD